MLPLHHVHGIINVLNCALWNGATCEILEGKFDSEKTWEILLRDRSAQNALSIFMAVPTVYANLAKFVNEGKLDPEKYT